MQWPRRGEAHWACSPSRPECRRGRPVCWRAHLRRKTASEPPCSRNQVLDPGSAFAALPSTLANGNAPEMTNIGASSTCSTAAVMVATLSSFPVASRSRNASWVAGQRAISEVPRPSACRVAHREAGRQPVHLLRQHKGKIGALQRQARAPARKRLGTQPRAGATTAAPLEHRRRKRLDVGVSRKSRRAKLPALATRRGCGAALPQRRAAGQHSRGPRLAGELHGTHRGSRGNGNPAGRRAASRGQRSREARCAVAAYRLF